MSTAFCRRPATFFSFSGLVAFLSTIFDAESLLGAALARFDTHPYSVGSMSWQESATSHGLCLRDSLLSCYILSAFERLRLIVLTCYFINKYFPHARCEIRLKLLFLVVKIAALYYYYFSTEHVVSLYIHTQCAVFF